MNSLEPFQPIEEFNTRYANSISGAPALSVVFFAGYLPVGVWLEQSESQETRRSLSTSSHFRFFIVNSSSNSNSNGWHNHGWSGSIFHGVGSVGNCQRSQWHHSIVDVGPIGHIAFQEKSSTSLVFTWQQQIHPAEDTGAAQRNEVFEFVLNHVCMLWLLFSVDCCFLMKRWLRDVPHMLDSIKETLGSSSGKSASSSSFSSGLDKVSLEKFCVSLQQSDLPLSEAERFVLAKLFSRGSDTLFSDAGVIDANLLLKVKKGEFLSMRLTWSNIDASKNHFCQPLFLLR